MTTGLVALRSTHVLRVYQFTFTLPVAGYLYRLPGGCGLVVTAVLRSVGCVRFCNVLPGSTDVPHIHVCLVSWFSTRVLWTFIYVPFCRCLSSFTRVFAHGLSVRVAHTAHGCGLRGFERLVYFARVRLRHFAFAFHARLRFARSVWFSLVVVWLRSFLVARGYTFVYVPTRRFTVVVPGLRSRLGSTRLPVTLPHVPGRVPFRVLVHFIGRLDWFIYVVICSHVLLA